MINAQRSAVQPAPSSVGYNGLMHLTMMKMMVQMKVTTMMKMTMMMALMNLSGEKQLLASLRAIVTQ